MTGFNRRNFLANSALGLAGAALAAGLGGSLLHPGPALAKDIVFPQGRCAAPGAGPRVLVAYASRCGSTGGVAKAIADALCAAGARAETRLAKEVENLAAYDAVVVGSAIRSHGWLSDAKDFVGDQQEILQGKPTAYFLTCLALSQPGPGALKTAMEYMQPALEAAPKVKPAALGYFAGSLDYSKLGFFMRSVMRSKMEKKGVKEGDYRDFPAIKAWARGIAPKLGMKAIGA